MGCDLANIGEGECQNLWISQSGTLRYDSWFCFENCPFSLCTWCCRRIWTSENISHYTTYTTDCYMKHTNWHPMSLSLMGRRNNILASTICKSYILHCQSRKSYLEHFVSIELTLLRMAVWSKKGGMTSSRGRFFVCAGGAGNVTGKS